MNKKYLKIGSKVINIEIIDFYYIEPIGKRNEFLLKIVGSKITFPLGFIFKNYDDAKSVMDQISSVLLPFEIEGEDKIIDVLVA